MFYRKRPRRFVRIGRSNDGETRNSAQTGDVLDGLVRRAIFAESDAVVCQHVDRFESAQSP
jgi:hypothetical protein